MRVRYNEHNFCTVAAIATAFNWSAGKAHRLLAKHGRPHRGGPKWANYTTAVMEACVFGIPDEQWGESVIAAVALKPGMSVTEEELIDFCKERLARYKSPKKITFHDSLPKSAMGKILRKDLREPYWKGHERRIN